VFTLVGIAGEDDLDAPDLEAAPKADVDSSNGSAGQASNGQPRALGRKVSDEYTVPVCRVHHRELHRQGDEAAWWQRMKIDPLPIAHRLWRHARPNGAMMAADVESASASSPANTAGHSSTPAKPDPSRDDQSLVS
jgi:hypothetical protein